MLSGGRSSPNHIFKSEFTQPTFGLRISIHAIVVSRPGSAKESSVSE
jgi:hypothetical protein